MSGAGHNCPTGANGSPPYRPDSGLRLSFACRVELHNLTDDPALLCLCRSEDGWLRGPGVKIVQPVGVQGRVSFGNLASKRYIAIEALQRFGDSITHLATLEPPIVCMEEKTGVF